MSDKMPKVYVTREDSLFKVDFMGTSNLYGIEEAADVLVELDGVTSTGRPPKAALNDLEDGELVVFYVR